MQRRRAQHRFRSPIGGAALAGESGVGRPRPERSNRAIADSLIASRTPTNASTSTRANGSSQQNHGPQTVQGGTTLQQVRDGATVGEGAHGAVVADMQAKLSHLGFGVQATGRMGPTTENTLKEFQRANQIADTGVLGPTTLAGMEKGLKASITLEEFQAIAPNLDEESAREWLPYLNASMAYADIDSEERKAAYLGQITHETDGFNTLEEYASGAAYEWRDDLGNTQAGDGRRYKGRGAIQLTGRANYREIGKRLGVDFEKNPELLETPQYAFLASADYWKRHDLNTLADKGDFEGITDVINYYDPETHRRKRRQYHAKATSVLADNRHRHEHEEGTIGGAISEAGATDRDMQPWWAQDPANVLMSSASALVAGPAMAAGTDSKRPSGPIQEWFESTMQGNALSTRNTIAETTTQYRINQGMKAGDNDQTTTQAGQMWQLSNGVAQIHLQSDEGNWNKVMDSAHTAAEQARSLRDSGLIPKDQAEAFIAEMGRKYTDAKTKAVPQANSNAPIIDQHRMNSAFKGGYCGIATLLSTLQANGIDPGVNINNRAQLDAYAEDMYVPGKGVVPAKVAARMRESGLENARFSMEGSVQSVAAQVAAGKPMPVGFASMGGQIADLPQKSKRYGHLQEGSQHFHQYGEAGHWATVVGVEGDPKNPTHFLVNDSDTGAQIRMTTAEFEQHTKARDGIWDIKY